MIWDFFIEKVIPIYVVISVLFTIFLMIFVGINILKKDNKNNYIQNIETKLNIYEQSYEEKVIEDNLKQ